MPKKKKTKPARPKRDAAGRWRLRGRFVKAPKTAKKPRKPTARERALARQLEAARAELARVKAERAAERERRKRRDARRYAGLSKKELPYKASHAFYSSHDRGEDTAMFVDMDGRRYRYTSPSRLAKFLRDKDGQYTAKFAAAGLTFRDVLAESTFTLAHVDEDDGDRGEVVKVIQRARRGGRFISVKGKRKKR